MLARVAMSTKKTGWLLAAILVLGAMTGAADPAAALLPNRSEVRHRVLQRRGRERPTGSRWTAGPPEQRKDTR